jgi:uncharacterized protein (TIGR00730 family)
MLKRICIYCGSSPGRSRNYASATATLGRELATRGIEVVYGGASIGLMGTVADAALAAGGRVTGVIPQALMREEIAHRGLADLRVVRSMHERKALMAELSDGFIALPGGLGTLDELFEIWTWAHLGFHDKPIGLLNVDGFFDHLLEHLDRSVREGFVRPELRARLITEREIEPLLQRMAG